MPREAEETDTFLQEDHQAAYIFDPDEDDEGQQQRPSKKRRVSKQTKSTKAKQIAEPWTFIPLLNGAEKPEFVRLREQLYEKSWVKIDDRIQDALRDSNAATLSEVTSFVGDAQAESDDKIPSAFIITGSNIAAQNLLFEQLSETLQRTSKSKFVRLRSSEVTNLKATLKKVIRDVTDAVTEDGEGGLQVASGQDVRRQYLDYDLEALHAFIKLQHVEHVFIAFEDSEGFDSGLLSDLIPLFNSWRSRIPFTLLFGVATSVELLQARLLKSVCQQIHGAQFDAVQTSSILETVFKTAVAAEDVPVRLGASLLRDMLHRQQNQVAGVQAFVSSLKYAYMCHFYSNALSPLLEDEISSQIQPEHKDSVRNTPSYRHKMEKYIELELEDDLAIADDPEELFSMSEENFLPGHGDLGSVTRRQWVSCLLRALLVLETAGVLAGGFPSAYAEAMANGIVVSEESTLASRIRRMDDNALIDFLSKTIKIYRDGEEELILGPSLEPGHAHLQTNLQGIVDDLTQLQKAAAEKGTPLRSKYGGQNKIMRTTVIAQRVQLSKDSAALNDEDKQFTKIVDDIVKIFIANLNVEPPHEVPLSECWHYDSKSPSKDVFVPRPRVVFERCLSRPHDYLACDCCKPDAEGLQATSPATAVLYQLYLETGNLINVADLWTAFQGVFSQKEDEDERQILVRFYCALAELRALGFIKSSKKKADHIAKLKWL